MTEGLQILLKKRVFSKKKKSLTDLQEESTLQKEGKSCSHGHHTCYSRSQVLPPEITPRGKFQINPIQISPSVRGCP